MTGEDMTGYTTSAFDRLLLRSLRTHPDQTAVALADRLGVDRAETRTALWRLQHHGLVVESHRMGGGLTWRATSKAAA